MISLRTSILLALCVLPLTTGDTAGSLRASLEQCCSLGRTLDDCVSIPIPVTGVPVAHQQLCWAALRLCCAKNQREASCQLGKAEARAGEDCGRLPGGDSESRECCEACQLGILTSTTAQSCDFSRLNLGGSWDQAFMECCTRRGTPGVEEENRGKCANYNPCQQRCVDTSGTVQCACYPGYQLLPDLRNCEDVDECIQGSHDCDLYTHNCHNVPGGFTCLQRAPEDRRPTPGGPQCTAGFLFNPATSTCDDMDECASNLHGCEPHTETCTNTIGSYQCVPVENRNWQACPPGYIFNPDPNKCQDIDECLQRLDNCNREREVCLNTQGGFICHPIADHDCPAGYKWDRLQEGCKDVDECADGSHTCNPYSQVCKNTAPGFTCEQKEQDCPVGFRRNPRTNQCEDIDECRENTHNCDTRTQVCVNQHGRFSCQDRGPQNLDCANGFERDPISGACLDIDECHEFSPCYLDQRCENTIGSYRCVCLEGYLLDSDTKTCKDINECQVATHNCLATQRCDNTIGSFTCTRILGCGTGYTFSASTGECEDIDECALNQHHCGQGFACRNSQGSFTCERVKCPPGERLLEDGRCAQPACGPGFHADVYGNCIDVDECSQGRPCRSNQVCINTPGSYECKYRFQCPAGYEVDDIGSGCKDIDECSTNSHECKDGQVCRNLPGRYSCDCPTGFTMNSLRECEDVNECSRYRGQVCAHNSECENTIGSYICNCKPGFKQSDNDKRSCVDVDECAEDPALCSHACINTWGSFVCACKPGYSLGPDKRTCQDIDECTLWADQGKLCIGNCVNDPGSYHCTCPDGYQLGTDKRTCIDVNECLENQVCRGSNEMCLNTRGSYKCNVISCPPNYVRDKEHKNRCKRELKCKHGDSSCLKEPQSISFNYITFQSNLRLPPSGQLDLFTMRGPGFTFTTVQFDLKVANVTEGPGVEPATEAHFNLRRTNYNEAVVSLIKPLKGPQDIELNLVLKNYHSGLYGGQAVAKLFIFVSEYEF